MCCGSGRRIRRFDRQSRSCACGGDAGGVEETGGEMIFATKEHKGNTKEFLTTDSTDKKDGCGESNTLQQKKDFLFKNFYKIFFT
jgi:hypothetical protein